MVATLAALKAAVSDELRRANDSVFQTRLDRLVAQAEQQIERDLRTGERQLTATLATVQNVAYVATPVDFHTAASLVRPGWQALAQITPEAYDASYGEVAGAPIAFSVWGSQVWFGPVPDGVYSFRLRYYAKLPRLADDDAHAAFLAHWDVYFYATLLCAAPGLVDDERVMMWGKLYEGAVTGANQTYTETLAAQHRPQRIYGRLS